MLITFGGTRVQMWAQFRLVVRFYDARHDSQHYTIPRCLGPSHPILSVSTRDPSLIAQAKLAELPPLWAVARHTFCQRYAYVSCSHKSC